MGASAADPDVGITLDELQLAARNHGMPLEALRYPVTPVGLHYLLSHYDIPYVDPAAWRLTIEGRVGTELTLSLEDLRARPSVTLAVTMECAGNGRARLSPRPVSQPWLLEAVGNAEWTGTPLRPILEAAGPLDDAREVVFTGLDRGVEDGEAQTFERSLSLAEALRDGVLLSYAVNGQPLPPQHGFPLRLTVPGWYGMAQVKWLHRITVIDHAFQGHQQARAYRLRQEEVEPGAPLSRMLPRSLMVPPGIPEFLSPIRFVPMGPVPLTGRAWSGWGAIDRVQVSADGGERWTDADLGPASQPSAWREWSSTWVPDAPGPYELVCRARDTAGNEQPLEASWNLGGYANNAVQRVNVLVQPSSDPP